MVISSIKKLETIKEMLIGYKKVLTVGCGGCASVCLAGGQKEVEGLCTQLAVSMKGNQNGFEINGFTVERQCEIPFLQALDEIVKPYDALLSMSCGAGIQFLAERYPDKPTFPAVDTVFTGVNQDIGWYEERCKNCGDCVLGVTGGICPIAMCAKSLLNGPCGGPQDGHCEVDKEVPCAWIKIHERLKAQGRLDNILTVFPAREWQDQVQGTLILEPYRKRYAKKEK
jgi:ferredoxin